MFGASANQRKAARPARGATPGSRFARTFALARASALEKSGFASTRAALL